MTRAIRRYALLVLLALPAAPGWSQDSPSPKVVIAPFDVEEDLLEEHAGLGDRLWSDTARKLSRGWSAVPLAELRSLLEVEVLQARQLFNSAEVAARIGRILGATHVLTGLARATTRGFGVHARLLHVESGEFSGWDSFDCEEPARIAVGLELLLERLGLLGSELLTDPAWFAGLPLLEQDHLCERRREAAREARDLSRAPYDWFLARSRRQDAEDHLAAVLRAAPDTAWANEAAGMKDLGEIYGQIPDDPLLAEYPGRALEELKELRKAVRHWGRDVEFERARMLLQATRSHLERLRSDPSYVDEIATVQRTTHHPAFADLRMKSSARPPFLVLVQHEDSTTGEERAGALLETCLDCLGRLDEELRRLPGRKSPLPRLGDADSRDLRLLRTVVFTERRAFERSVEDLGGEWNPALANDYYRPADQFVLLLTDGTAGTREEFREHLLSAAVRQLLHASAKIVTARETGEEISWLDPRILGRQYWFRLGFGTLVGTVDAASPGQWTWLAENRRLLSALEAAGQPGEGDWSLEDLLDTRNREDMLAAAARLGDFGQVERTALRFQARAWSFCHFLWFFRNGKYRRELIEYLGSELAGRSGSEELARILRGKGSPDWKALEEDWTAHTERLIGRSRGR